MYYDETLLTSRLLVSYTKTGDRPVSLPSNLPSNPQVVHLRSPFLYLPILYSAILCIMLEFIQLIAEVVVLVVVVMVAPVRQPSLDTSAVWQLVNPCAVCILLMEI